MRRNDNVIDEHRRLNPNCSYVRTFMSSNGMFNTGRFNMGRFNMESLKLTESFNATLKLVLSGDNHDLQDDDGTVSTEEEVFQSVSEGNNINCELFMVSCP